MIFMPPSGDNIPPRLLIRVFYELYAQTSQKEKKNIFIKKIILFSFGGKLENKVVVLREKGDKRAFEKNKGCSF